MQPHRERVRTLIGWRQRNGVEVRSPYDFGLPAQGYGLKALYEREPNRSFCWVLKNALETPVDQALGALRRLYGLINSLKLTTEDGHYEQAKR